MKHSSPMDQLDVEMARPVLKEQVYSVWLGATQLAFAGRMSSCAPTYGRVCGTVISPEARGLEDLRDSRSVIGGDATLAALTIYADMGRRGDLMPPQLVVACTGPDHEDLKLGVVDEENSKSKREN